MSEEELKVYILRLQSRSMTPSVAPEMRGRSVNDESNEDAEGTSSLDDGDEESNAGGDAESPVDHDLEGGDNELEAEDLEKLITVCLLLLARNTELTRYQSHARLSFCAIQGCKDTNDVKPTRRDDNDRPIFVETDDRGVDLVTPVWENSFVDNWSHWGNIYLEQCRDKSALKGNVYAKNLQQVLDEDFKTKLKNGAWKTMGQNARDKAKGIFEGKHMARKVRVMTHSRQTAVSTHIA